MTTRPTPHHRPRPRTLAKWLLAVVLLILGLLGPLGTDLLGPLQDHLGGTEAAAQPPNVQDGVGDPCPAGFTELVELCQFEQPACPTSPLDPTRRMLRSSEFTEFCEETVNVAADPAEYAVCAAPLEGYVVMDDGTDCRVLQLRTCEIGTRINSELCRATIRRSWTCPSGSIRRNEFNTCYIVPNTVVTAPVCATGAPDLVIVDCADYVGNDFVEPPGSVACGFYFTGSAPAMTNAANPYWCQFQQSYLKIACHSTTPPPGECGPSTALCLKRGSGTGGCDSIAHTIFCRNEQFDYEQQHTAALADNVIDQAEQLLLRTLSALVRDEGCEPCIILPFEPIPPHCPGDTHETANFLYPRVFQYQAIEQEHDIENINRACRHLNTWDETTMVNPNDPSLDCAAIASRCNSPSSGNPVWSTTHVSGLAVVNSSVIVRLHDVPVTVREYPRVLTLDNLINGRILWRTTFAEFPGTGLVPSEQVVRTFTRPPPDITTASPAALANRTNECAASNAPMFKLIVEELWPDRPADAAAITAMFGASALDWWTNLSMTPGAQRRLTEASGLPWWPALSTPDERDERIASLKTKIDCNSAQSSEVWCRWTPARSGYYRLKVGGGWLMTVGEVRGVQNAADLATLSRNVQRLTPQQRQRVRDTLTVLGCGPYRTPDPSCAWSPSSVGLQNDLSDIIPLTPDGLYRRPGEGQQFPGLDLRVRYQDRGVTTKYTETQTFGVEVHEVRVHTVSPAR